MLGHEDLVTDDGVRPQIEVVCDALGLAAVVPGPFDIGIVPSLRDTCRIFSCMTRMLVRVRMCRRMGKRMGKRDGR
jgi:hypothetical protein